MPRVHITAPSRLHFGLWSLGDGHERQFGGVGAMVNPPQLTLTITDAPQLTAKGPDADRALAFARRWAEFHHRATPTCHIEIHSAIPPHAGLGSGTQLALSISAGLSAYCDLPTQSPQELALSVGRGLRSAVGTYGCAFGGLIVEQGKLADELLSPLECRLDLPDDWRFVLIRPQGLSGLAGEDEANVFGALPKVSPSISDQLIALARERLVPAVVAADFGLFAETLYEYGRLSGDLFAARQGGPFNGPKLTSIIQQIRDVGYSGVGQSSWGPTIFVLTPSQHAANRVIADLRLRHDASTLDLLVAPPNNWGAQIHVSEESELASRT
ncbi:MAG: beta-RFAP synthase [Planctomycetia bacterium]|nr:beta-RFAP synthase [Planctomycetia bacterium]